MFKLGLVINPYAGIGGALALKGSDGKEVREQALALGAKLKANDRTKLALELIQSHSDDIHIFTASGLMGEELCQSLGFSYSVVYQADSDQTEGVDTELAAKAILEQGVDLVLFAGGDGTARNLCHVVDQTVPVLGIPAGCKIHSGVYAVTPQAAGRVLVKIVSANLVSVHQKEVMDIDESLFRQGKVKAKIYGEMQVPDELEYMQAVKVGGIESEDLVLNDIAAYVIELMEEHPQCRFVMGSGSTVAFIMQELGLDNTLLGVDVIQNGQLVASDVTSEQLLSLTEDKPCKLVITLIGGQGHILGRGNQQLSPEFIRRIGKENILLVATKNKLQSLQQRPLIADSGDSELDQALSGLMTVITGYNDHVLYPIN